VVVRSLHRFCVLILVLSEVAQTATASTEFAHPFAQQLRSSLYRSSVRTVIAAGLEAFFW